MITVFSKIRDKHALWYKGIVFVICVLFCTYLLTKKQSIHHTSISIGDVWTNDDLVSEVDFLIEKSEQEIIEDESQLTKQEIPYFHKTDITATPSVLELAQTPSEKAILKKCLDSIYHVGYYYNSQNNPNDFDSVYLVNNNEVSLIKSNALFDEQRVETFFLNKELDSAMIKKIMVSLQTNIEFDANFNHEIQKANSSSISLYKSKVHKGDLIIKKNELINKDKLVALTNYYKELDAQGLNSDTWLMIFGKFIACILILSIIMLFLAFFRKAIFSQNTHVTFIFLIICAVVMASSIISHYKLAYLYAVPFCLVPILIRVFFDSRTALFSFLNIVLLCAFFTNDKFEFVFIQLIAGIGTIFSVADMGKRSKLLVSALLTFVFYSISYVSYHLINNTTSAILNFENYVPFLVSSLFVLFSFPLIFLFEKLFGFVSDFTLLELCDLNSPLLRMLSQKVPGTFQHSLQVANLAEEACYVVGGNPLLVRTGAMYHDIGKTFSPRYFTENQVGEVSPHADLSSEESAKIIIDHIIKGIELAKENNLPENIIDFIRTHHGTTTTRYFLHIYKKEHEGEVINEDLFRYPGPIPFSKETAILMMADSVEAASRSLKKYDAVAIDDLVDKIINHQINENQFINADITFRDINQVKKIFKKRLMNIYHVRIEYPR